MENYLKEMIDRKSKRINDVVELVCNTVKAKYLYGKGGWELVTQEFGNAYCNPNFGMSPFVLADKAKELKLDIGYTTIETNLDLITKLTNEKLKGDIVSIVRDRRHVFIAINV